MEASETKDVGQELEKVVQDKLKEDKASDEIRLDTEKDSSGAHNKSVAAPMKDKANDNREEISQELAPTRSRLKKPKKLVARKLGKTRRR